MLLVPRSHFEHPGSKGLRWWERVGGGDVGVFGSMEEEDNIHCPRSGQKEGSNYLTGDTNSASLLMAFIHAFIHLT